MQRCCGFVMSRESRRRIAHHNLATPRPPPRSRGAAVAPLRAVRGPGASPPPVSGQREISPGGRPRGDSRGRGQGSGLRDLGDAVLGEQVVQHLDEERLDGAVGVGGEALELAPDLGRE